MTPVDRVRASPFDLIFAPPDDSAAQAALQDRLRALFLAADDGTINELLNLAMTDTPQSLWAQQVLLEGFTSAEQPALADAVAQGAWCLRDFLPDAPRFKEPSLLLFLSGALEKNPSRRKSMSRVLWPGTGETDLWSPTRAITHEELDAALARIEAPGMRFEPTRTADVPTDPPGAGHGGAGWRFTPVDVGGSLALVGRDASGGAAVVCPSRPLEPGAWQRLQAWLAGPPGERRQPTLVQPEAEAHPPLDSALFVHTAMATLAHPEHAGQAPDHVLTELVQQQARRSEAERQADNRVGRRRLMGWLLLSRATPTAPLNP